MKTVPFRQKAFAYLLGVGSFSAFLLPGTVSKKAGSAALAAPIAAGVVSVACSFLFYHILSRYGSLRRFAAVKISERAAKAAGILAALWIAGICVFYACAFYDRLASTAFSHISKPLCTALLFLCAALFALRPARVLYSGAQLAFGVMVLSLLSLLVFSFGGISLKELLPVKHNALTSVLPAFLFPLASPALLGFLLFYDEGEAPAALSLRAVRACLLAGNGLMFFVIFLCFAVFGESFAERLAYPFFALIKSAHSLLSAEPLESLVSGIWILISVSFFMLMVHFIAQAIRRECGERRRLWIYPLLLLLYVLCLALPQQRQPAVFALGSVMPAGNLILFVIVPGLLCAKKDTFVLKP